MNPVQKVFDNNAPFPFSFAYKSTKSPQTELPDHFHEWYEIVYVYRGKGTFFIDHTFYEMRQGDVFLIPANTIHRATPDKEDPVTSTAIYFNPSLVQLASLDDSFSYLQSFEEAARYGSYRIEIRLPQRQRVDLSMESIQYELNHPNKGYQQAILLQLLQLLLFLNRELTPGTKPPQAAESIVGPFWMRDILRYIDQCFCEEIGLTTLAKQASVSPAHFSRVFKQLTGMNVTAYLMTKRIIRAKHLLSETDLNISVIAQMCGFESLPHFHSMFKRVLGMTPAAHRKSTR